MIHTNPQHPELIVAFRWRAVYKYYFYIIRGIVESIVSGVAEGLFTMLIIVAVLFAIVGVAIGITYFVQKKNGVLNSYEAFSDIMTEDEFERWQKRKNKIK